MQQNNTLKIGIWCLSLFCTELATGQDSVKYRKGSYLYYGQPNIEDNSMFIEEAFNQERAVIQHISNLIIDQGNLTYTFTQEIPIPDERQQLSFTFGYNSFNDRPLNAPTNGGTGDLYLNYRYMLMDKRDWAILIPRISLIVPLGDSKYGYGTGAWGAQTNLALTKRLNKRITSHWNAGLTTHIKEDYFAIVNNELELVKQKTHTSYNLGSSLIYLFSDSFNFMCEYVSGFNRGFDENGASIKTHDLVLNPGFRFAFSIGNTQVVPGFGVPLNFTDGQFVSSGSFFYLSIEPNYLNR